MTGTLPQVITLLEEAKEALEGLEVHRSASPTNVKAPLLDIAVRVHSKITEAENVLMGEPPCQPEHN